MTVAPVPVRDWSSWSRRSRAWLSILLLTPAGFVAVFSEPHFARDSWGDLACEAIGWQVFLLGATFRWWATLYVGGRKCHQLVSHGPYSTCRNPLYFGTWLLAVAIAFLMQSFVFGLAVTAVCIFYLQISIPDEERFLAREFPAAFADFRARVPCFFPRLTLYQSPEVIEVRVSGMRAELLRTLRWMWIPTICHFLNHFRVQDWWPHWYLLP